MAYTIEFSEDAVRHLGHLRAYYQRIVVDAIESQLSFEPGVPTRHRKRLFETSIAGWELRVGDFRVLYNVDEAVHLVIIVAIGEKVRNVLLVEGKEFPL